MKRSRLINTLTRSWTAGLMFLSILTLPAAAQVSSGLVANYSFDSGNAADEANGNNGALNGPILTTGRLEAASTAYSFDGSSYINCGKTAAIQGLTTGFTLSAWFKRSATPTDIEAIVSKWAPTVASEHFLLGVTTSNRIIFATAGPGNQGTINATAFALNAWNHVVLTWESDGLHKLYLNGTLIGTTQKTAHTVNVTTPVDMLIGAQSPTYRNFKGSIDDVRIYNRALVAEEVTVLNQLDPSRQEQVLSFDEVPDKSTADPSFELVGSSDASLPVSFVSYKPTVISVSGTTATTAAFGKTYLSVVQAGDATHNGAFLAQEVIVKSPQTITFNPLGDRTFGAPNFSLTASSTSGLAVAFTSSNTDVATVSGSLVTLRGGGTTIITATQAGNGNYFEAEPVERELVVHKADQTITFGGLPDRELTERSFTLNAVSSAALPLTYSSSDPAVASISGNTVTLLAPGTVTITASQAGNGSYNAAPSVERSLTVIMGSSLVAKYMFSGNTNDDAKGNNGAATNASLVTDRFAALDHAYSFNGTNMLINCGNTDVIRNLDKAYTLSAWFKRTATTTDLEVIVGKWGNAAASDHFLLGTQNNRIVFATAGPGKNGITSTTPYNLQVWNHVVLTYEFATGVHKLYLNNVLIGTTSLAPHTLAITSSVNMIIGAQANSSRFFTGSIDDVSIYSTALTASQIETLYSAAPSKQNQTIEFGTIVGKKYGMADFTLSATASSSLPVTFTSSNANVISVNGTTATITGIGTAVLSAVQAGDETYNGTFVLQPVTVSKNDQTLDLSQYATLAIATGTVLLPEATDQGLDVNYTSSDPSVITISGRVATLVSFGETTITADQDGNDFYNPFETTQLVTVEPGTQQIDFAALDTHQYGDAPIELTALSSAGLTITYTSSNVDVATVSGNVITIVGIGSTTITAAQAGNNFYNEAVPVEHVLVVEKGDQTIEASLPSTVVYSTTPIELPEETTAGLIITYVSSNELVAAVNGATLTLVGAGTTTITASQDGNSVYNAAENVELNLTVEKAQQQIGFEPFGSVTYGDDAITLPAQSSAALTISYSSNNEAVATVAGNVLTIVAPGEATITAQQDGNTLYHAASAQQVLTVDKASQTLTLEPFGQVVYGSGDITLPANSSVGLTVTYASSNPSVASVNGNTLVLGTPGTTIITATQSGNDFYLPTSEEETLTFSKATQEISFDGLPAKTFGDAAFELVATSSSALAVSFTSSDASVATINGTTLTITGGGTTTITAIQSGNDFYEAATSVERTLTVNKASQSISFDEITTRVLGDPEFGVTVSTTSGLAVSLTASNNHVAIDGLSVALVSAGSVTLTANQNGNASYEAAPAVSRTFCINPPKPVITASFENSSAPILTSSVAHGNQWYRNGVSVNASNNTFAPTEPGLYTVRASVEGCTGNMSDEFVLIITGAEEALETSTLEVYPNPAAERVTITLPDTNGAKQVVIYSPKGEVLFKQATNARSIEVNVNGFARGLSYVVVTTNDGQHLTGKIVKE